MALGTMNAGKRRLVYGLNVAVAVVLAFLLAAVVMWAGSFGGRVDVTRSGQNSLSSRTQQLLAGLEQEITITGLYSTALSEIRPHAEKHKAGVSDLLDLYETAARGKVVTQMIDPSDEPARVTGLLKRLAEKPGYKGEAAPHAAALDKFPAVNAKIVEVMQNDLTELGRLRGVDAQLAQMSELGAIERNLQATVQSAQQTESDVEKLKLDEIPRYGRAVELVKSYLGQAQTVLEEHRRWMTESGGKLMSIGEESRRFFRGAATRYNDLIAEVAVLVDETKDLEGVALETVYEDLKRGETVLVETPDEAVVLAADEVWPWRMDRNAPPPPDGDPRDFAGEQAVSSAILKLTQKERTAVVFTRFGGTALLEAAMPQNPMMGMPKAPFSLLKQSLEKENFITREWDVQTEDAPPAIEDAARTIYVVFPPEPPQQPNQMRPATTPPISAEQKQRVFDAVGESGMAMFLTRWAPPSAPYIPVPQKYEYNDYLRKNWGIGVEDGYLTLSFSPNPQRKDVWIPVSREPIIASDAFEFTDHPIAKPLQGQRLGLATIAPLTLVADDAKPEGVTVEPILTMGDSESVWAIKDLNRLQEDFTKNQGTRRYDDDITPPFPLGLAATNADGGKLVVFASDRFAADMMLNMGQLAMVGGTLQVAKLYPGNPDLFVNGLHWLTGDADRIAVGPRSGDVPRLDRLKDDGTLKFTRVFLVGIWPATALLVGACVWLVRRR